MLHGSLIDLLDAHVFPCGLYLGTHCLYVTKTVVSTSAKGCVSRCGILLPQSV